MSGFSAQARAYSSPVRSRSSGGGTMPSASMSRYTSVEGSRMRLVDSLLPLCVVGERRVCVVELIDDRLTPAVLAITWCEFSQVQQQPWFERGMGEGHVHPLRFRA